MFGNQCVDNLKYRETHTYSLTHPRMWWDKPDRMEEGIINLETAMTTKQ